MSEITKLTELTTALRENNIPFNNLIRIFTREEATALAEEILETIIVNPQDRLVLAKGIGDGVAWKMMDGSTVLGIKIAVDAGAGGDGGVLVC